jgi:cell division protein FtsW (lipid II flippase)
MKTKVGVFITVILLLISLVWMYLMSKNLMPNFGLGVKIPPLALGGGMVLLIIILIAVYLSISRKPSKNRQ